MDGQLIAELLEPPTPERERPWTTAGEVTSTSPLRVEVDGVPVGARRLAGYSPTLGDRAVLLRVGVEWVAIGAVA